MRKVSLIAISLLLLAGLASAQIPTKGNVFFGYSFYNTDLSSIDRANTNGWEGTIEGKFFPIPFLSLVADFDGHSGSQNFPLCLATPNGISCAQYNADVTEHNYLFGPRASVRVGRMRPFAEALLGIAHVDANAAGSDTSFATAVGGGADYKVFGPVAWRVQGDWVQTRFFSTTQSNARLSTGIVVRF
jgi:opacity protein-like surface antigen